MSTTNNNNNSKNDTADLSLAQTQPPPASWNTMNLFCRRISQASRCCRSLEVVVQARWIESYDDRVKAISATYPDLSLTKARKTALVEACEDFGWSEKDLRNKMAVWRGYHDIKEAGGWVCLVFASMGLYRFCKYRISFDAASMQMLRRLRSRFEVAADTLHPTWRQLLGMIGEPAGQVWTGHPHDWVVSESGPPVELRETYLQWDPDFEFEQLEESVVDEDAWGAIDPRSTLAGLTAVVRSYTCDKCGEVQSAEAKDNCCKCFPDLYGATKRRSCPVQVYRTDNGRNNGLLACCPFERGSAIGEFVGLVTRGLENVDVMQGGTEELSYQVSELPPIPLKLAFRTCTELQQIWQGRQGNYTRFVNHSCHPSSQFERFTWLGTLRVLLVSKGIDAGQEITVDYSNAYWAHLDKQCLCGEPGCRYKNRSGNPTPRSR